MKIAIISDIHVGVRNDSQIFLNHYKEFFEEVFFPTLEARGIKTIVDLGDIFDRRKYINFNTFNSFKKVYFEKLNSDGYVLYQNIGNHDTFYRSTNEVNSPRLLLSEEFDNFILIEDDVLEIEFDQTKFAIVPWINPSNQIKILDQMAKTDARVCLGHFQITGFEMARGSICSQGLDQALFTKFDLTLSGHFHNKTRHGNIMYVGSPFQTTWGDFDITKGFHILDTDTLEMEFIENKKSMFNKIVFNDQELSDEFCEQFRNTYIKVIIDDQSNQYRLEQFVNKLKEYQPADLKVIKVAPILDDTKLEDAAEVEDTLTVIKQYIENDKRLSDTERDISKNIALELYQEALHMEI